MLKPVPDFGPVPQPVMEICAIGDVGCTNRNTVRDQQLSWNRQIPAELSMVAHFIQAFNNGGTYAWNQLDQLAQALILGAQGLPGVTGYVPYGIGADGPQTWAPQFDTTGPQLDPPPGVPAGPGSTPFPPAPPAPDVLHQWPYSIATKGETASAPQPVPVGASPFLAAIYQLLPGSPFDTQLEIMALLTKAAAAQK